MDNQFTKFQDEISSQKEQFIQKINDLDEDKLSKLIDCFDKIVKENDNPVKKNNKKGPSDDKPKKVIDKTTDKYKLLLKYVNGILKNINKDPIDNLTDFRDIDRLDIIKKENIELLDELAPTLFKHFSKEKCGYYRKTKNISLNCLRGMCKEIGLELKKRKFNRQVKSVFKTHMLYSIV